MTRKYQFKLFQNECGQNVGKMGEGERNLEQTFVAKMLGRNLEYTDCVLDNRP